MQITDAMVEKAAQALYEMLADELPERYSIVLFPVRWEEVGSERQDWWRDRARKMLKDIFVAPEAGDSK